MKRTALIVMCILLPLKTFALHEYTRIFKLNTAAAPAALAGAYAAITGDISGFFYNPASQGSIRYAQAQFTYQNSIYRNSATYTNFVMPVENFGVIGVSYIYNRQPGVQKPGSANPLEESVLYNNVVSVQYSCEPLEGKYIGGTLKYIRADADGYYSNSYAVDLGMLFKVNEFINIGIAYRDLGTDTVLGGIRDNLPGQLAAGAAWGIGLDAKSSLLLVAEPVYEFDGEGLRAYAGTELRYSDFLKLRFGYNAEREAVNFITAGFGMVLDIAGIKYNFDYTYIPTKVNEDNYDASQLITISAKF